MMLFSDCLSQIVERGATTTRMDFAVAFWGSGAGEELMLLDQMGRKIAPSATRVICNLRMGGTNPFEIEKLLMAGIEVKHLDRLHAKIYRYDGFALVGSANASANGLGFEGAEANWSEAGVLIEDEPRLKSVDTWFEVQWDQSRPVTKSDLKMAKAAFARQRATRPPLTVETNQRLLPFLQRRLEEFKGRRVYLVCFTTEPYREESADYVRERLAEGMQIDVVEEWESTPTDAILIEFIWRKNSSPRFSAIYRTGPTLREKRLGRGKGAYTVHELDILESTQAGELPVEISKRSIMPDIEAWKDVIRRIRVQTHKSVGVTAGL